MPSGISWVIGGLLAILAIALVIAGATGHAEQLFQGVTGKKAGSSSSSGGVGGIQIGPKLTPGANLSDNVDAALAGLAQVGAGGGGQTGTGAGAVNPYAGLGPAMTTNPAGSV